MEMVEKTEGSITILTLSGEIDLNQSPKLRTALREKAKNKTHQLLLDFAAVAYVDSSGLATLIEYYQSAKAFSGKFAICCLVPRVRSSFDLVRLSEVFTIYPDQAVACQALTSGSA
jgi:anti-sigma B factor antagonist